MIAVDTNILVYAEVPFSEFHERAREIVARLVEGCCARLSCTFSETPRHLEVLDQLFRESRVIGNLAHDAHVAALCIEHGITEILTADRDFSRFPLKATNPFRP